MSNWNPTDDQLRAIEDNDGLDVLHVYLARLVLRERETIADQTARAEKAEAERDRIGRQFDHGIEVTAAGWLKTQRERDAARAALARAEAERDALAADLDDGRTPRRHEYASNGKDPDRCTVCGYRKDAVGGEAGWIHRTSRVIRAAIAGGPPAAVAVPHAFEPPPIGWAVAMNAPLPCSATVDSGMLPGLPGACRLPAEDPIHRVAAGEPAVPIHGTCANSGWHGDSDPASDRHHHCYCGRPCVVCVGPDSRSGT